MTLDKAIEILQDFHTDPNAFFTNDLPDAVKLGIEALKRCKEARRKVYFTARTLLPGETEE